MTLNLLVRASLDSGKGACQAIEHGQAANASGDLAGDGPHKLQLQATRDLSAETKATIHWCQAEAECWAIVGDQNRLDDQCVHDKEVSDGGMDRAEVGKDSWCCCWEKKASADEESAQVACLACG